MTPDRRAALMPRRLVLGAALAAACGAVTLNVARSAPQRIRTPYLFGLHVSQDDVVNHLRQAELEAGRTADVVLYFSKIRQPFPEVLEYLVETGYEVALCLEFWEGEAEDDRFDLPSVLRGDHDADLRRWLSRIARLPRPIHVRPLHEFNGDWYPWAVHAPGNKVEDFIPAWRRIASIARTVAPDRARLQLCFNRADGHQDESAPGSRTALQSFYPGDAYVDELVLNGYNRPTYQTSHPFALVIGPYYKQLREFRPNLPLWIGETACSEVFSDKPAWISDMFHSLLTDHPVQCLTWFNQRKSISGEPIRDWPFDTSRAAQAAFRKGLRLQHD